MKGHFLLVYPSHLNFWLRCKLALHRSCTACALPRLAHLRLAINLIVMGIYLSLFFTISLAFAQPTPTFSKIVLFGDSLTDNGNLYAFSLHQMPKLPPYFNGRFSNGPTWSEYVAKYFLVPEHNYAVGGETTIFHDPIEGYLPYTLSISYYDYLARTAMQDRSNTLFIIWIGANDYLNGVKDLEVTTTNVVDTIRGIIEGLIYYGAKNILLINLPDLSRTPFGDAVPYQEILHTASITHNLKLDAMVDELKLGHKNINIHEYNSFNLFNDIHDHTDVYNKKYHTHVTDLTNSCWQGGYVFTRESESLITQQIETAWHKQAMISANEFAHAINKMPALSEAYRVSKTAALGLEPCKDPDEFLFWDKVHPTAIAHKVIALTLIEFIEQYYTYHD